MLLTTNWRYVDGNRRISSLICVHPSNCQLLGWDVCDEAHMSVTVKLEFRSDLQGQIAASYLITTIYHRVSERLVYNTRSIATSEPCFAHATPSAFTTLRLSQRNNSLKMYCVKMSNKRWEVNDSIFDRGIMRRFVFTLSSEPRYGNRWTFYGKPGGLRRVRVERMVEPWGMGKIENEHKKHKKA